jgi:hypothetical protein
MRFHQKKYYKNCIRHWTNEKYAHTSVPNLPLLTDLEQKVGELVLSITPSPSIIIFIEYFKLEYRKNVVIVTLATGIIFSLFT